ncbi:MAG TPA: hypothetical protein VGC30_08480 [Dokdonella sp.]
MWGHRPQPGEWLVRNGMLNEAALAAIDAVKIVRTYDVPYVGSCNKRGDTVYIDYELPKTLRHRGRSYDVDRYIVMHEVVEMLFEHALKFQYRDAHQIALRVERALVQSDGLPWSVYDRFCARWIRRIGARKRYPNPPPDIELKPEIDEDDKTTLRRMGAKRAARTGRDSMR